MKFTELSSKFNSQLKRSEKGKKVKAKEVEQLISLLEAKKDKYQAKLKTDLSGKKRDSFETKLKVVEAHLKKVGALAKESKR